VRFASVYRDFREAADFQGVLGEIADRAAKGPDTEAAVPVKARPAEAPDRKH
jgi:transcriptional repressor NrdR